MRASDRSAVVATLALAALGASCSAPKAYDAPRPLVVVVTPAEAAAPAEYRGAEALVEAYSGKDSKVELSHAVLPGTAKPGGRPEAVVASFIAEAASDARVKAVVVDPALPGSAEGFRRSKLRKPGLLGVSGGSREDVLGIEASADLVVDLDRVYRAYLIPWAAKKMGAKALVAAYVQGEYADPASVRERAIMSAASVTWGSSTPR